MCDYSLEVYRTQPAREGVPYETHRFPSNSIGLVDPQDRATAICVACDMRLLLEDIPEDVQRALGVKDREHATFASLDSATYRDGVRFDNGAQVTLQRLGVGLKVTVVDALTTAHETHEARETVEAI